MIEHVSERRPGLIDLAPVHTAGLIEDENHVFSDHPGVNVNAGGGEEDKKTVFFRVAVSEQVEADVFGRDAVEQLEVLVGRHVVFFVAGGEVEFVGAVEGDLVAGRVYRPNRVRRFDGDADTD